MELNLGRGAEKYGKYVAALDYYSKSQKDPKAKGTNIVGDIEFLIARTTARFGLNEDPSKLDDAQKKLDAFVKGKGTHYRYYEAVGVLGQVLLAKKDYETAITALEAATVLLRQARSEIWKTFLPQAPSSAITTPCKLMDHSARRSVCRAVVLARSPAPPIMHWPMSTAMASPMSCMERGSTLAIH